MCSCAIMNDNTSIPLGVIRAMSPARAEVRQRAEAPLPAQSPDKASRKELAALRQLALGTLEVTPTATDGQLLAGSGIDAPASQCQVTAEEIVVEGWVLGRNCTVAAVELVGPKATLRQAPVLLRRPDVAAAHPQVSWAETSGFRITMSAREMAQASRVEVRAALKDDSSVCLGVIRTLRGDGSDDLLTAAEAKVSQLRKDAEEASTREAKLQQKLRRRNEEYQAVLSAASHNEALQRELAALRQLALGTLEVTPTATDGQLLAGSGIDAPASRCQVTAEEIVVEGWVLGRNLRRCSRRAGRAKGYPETGASPTPATGCRRRTSSSILGRNQRLPDYDERPGDGASLSGRVVRRFEGRQQRLLGGNPRPPRRWLRRSPDGCRGQGIPAPQRRRGSVNTRGKVAGEAPPAR